MNNNLIEHWTSEQNISLIRDMAKKIAVDTGRRDDDEQLLVIITSGIFGVLLNLEIFRLEICE